jgi:formyl-CoA transferase
VQHIDDIDDIVTGWTIRHPRAYVVEKLQQYRVPHAPVRELDEVINDPHMHARGTLQNIQHPEYGELTIQHSPMRYEGVPLIPLKASSRLGADGRDVFVNWLGLPEPEFEALVKEGVL